MLQQTAPKAVAIASEVAVAAAEEFDRLLSGIKIKGPRDAYQHDGLARSGVSEMSASLESAWQAIEEGGWLVIGQESAGERFALLDLAELAMVWGKHLVPAPFIETVVALRWMSGSIPTGRRGYTYALRAGADALVPFGALDGVTFLDRLGEGAVRSDSLAPLDVDDFAPTLPLARVRSVTRCAPEIVRETIVLHTAETIGGAEFLLGKTVDYVNFRKAYGQELGKFQVIRHRLVNILDDIETARGLMVYAANDDSEVLAACREAVRLIRGVVQLELQQHGGIGFTWDLGIHRYLRHAIAVEKLLGDYGRAQGEHG